LRKFYNPTQKKTIEEKKNRRENNKVTKDVNEFSGCGKRVRCGRIMQLDHGDIKYTGIEVGSFFRASGIVERGRRWGDGVT